MSYCLVSQGKFLGPVGTVEAYAQIIDIVEQFDKTTAGGGRLPALSELVQRGHTNDPKRVAKDIYKLITHRTDLPKNAIINLRNLKDLLLKARQSADIDES